MGYTRNLSGPSTVLTSFPASISLSAKRSRTFTVELTLYNYNCAPQIHAQPIRYFKEIDNGYTAPNTQKLIDNRAIWTE